MEKPPLSRKSLSVSGSVSVLSSAKVEPVPLPEEFVEGGLTGSWGTPFEGNGKFKISGFRGSGEASTLFAERLFVLRAAGGVEGGGGWRAANEHTVLGISCMSMRICQGSRWLKGEAAAGAPCLVRTARVVGEVRYRGGGAKGEFEIQNPKSEIVPTGGV